MAETDAKPMTDADITAADSPRTEAPLKGVVNDEGGTLSGRTTDATQAIKDGATKYGAQATDKVRALADTGKDKAVGALDQFSTLIEDAAAQVDDKFGAQYGNYARSAASSLSSFSEQVKGKDVDQLVDDAREFVRRSPAVAIGVAAAVGFAIARLVQSGIDGGTGRDRA